MDRMKVVELVAPREARVREVRIPRPGHGEVLVKIKACAICTLERRLFTGEQKIHYPIVFGHEVSGEVVDIGDDVLSDLQPGEPVVLDLLNRCGECPPCRTGRSNQCLNKFDPRLPVLGGMAQYLSRPARQVFRIDGSVGFLRAALTEPLSDCVHSLMRTHLSPNMSVLVIGAGTMGLLHTAIVKHYGMFCAVSDVDRTKLSTAAEMGADRVVNISERDAFEALSVNAGLKGMDVVIVTAPGKEAVEEALDVVGNMGIIVLYSANPEGVKIELDPNFIHYREITITGSESRTERDFHQAVNMQDAGDMRLEKLVSAVFPIEEAPKALEVSLDPALYRVVVAMDESAIDEFAAIKGA